MGVDTDRVVLIWYTDGGEARVGSGLRVRDRFVLTADHCAQGTGHQVELVNGTRFPARVHVRSHTSDVDLAVMAVDDPEMPPVAALRPARVRRAVAEQVAACQALGFPRWRRNEAGDRVIAQIDGYVPTAEGLHPKHAEHSAPDLLELKGTGAAIQDHPTEPGELVQSSPWGGMSGAVVLASGLLLGVVRSHNLAAGGMSLTVTPLDAISHLHQELTAAFIDALGLPPMTDWPLVPEPRGSHRPWTSNLMGDIAARGAIDLAALSPDCSKLAVWRGTSGEVFDVERRSIVFEVDRAPGARFWWKPKWLHITTEPPLLYARIGNDAQFVWDFEQRSMLTKLPADIIQCTSSDGAYLLTRELVVNAKYLEYGFESQSGTDRVTIWDGRAMARVASHPFRALRLAASLDRVAMANEEGVLVFDIEDGQVLADIAARDVGALAISADGSVVAVGLREGGRRVLYIYGTETSALKSTFAANYDEGIALNRDGSLLAMGFDKRLLLRDLESGQELLTQTFGQSILCLGFSNDRSLLVAIGDGGSRAKIIQVRDPMLDIHFGEAQLRGGG